MISDRSVYYFRPRSALESTGGAVFFCLHEACPMLRLCIHDKVVIHDNVVKACPMLRLVSMPDAETCVSVTKSCAFDPCTMIFLVQVFRMFRSLVRACTSKHDAAFLRECVHVCV